MAKTIALVMLICISLTLADDPKTTCPKFTCSKTLATGVCESSKYDATKLFSTVEVGNACTAPAHCIQNKDKQEPFNHNDLYFRSKADLALACGNYTVTETPASRWPGESCEKDTECYSVAGTAKCENKKCTGVAKDGECTGTSQCLVGHWCKVVDTKGTCVPQLEIGAVCKKTEECVNNGICNAGKCIKMQSLPLGSKIEVDSGDYNGWACENGIPVNHEGSDWCMKVLYDRPETEKSEFQACTNVNEACAYKATGVKDLVVKDLKAGLCQCGYNADGKSYCPRFHDGSNIL